MLAPQGPEALARPGCKTAVHPGSPALGQQLPRVWGTPQTERESPNLKVLNLTHLQASWCWECQAQETLLSGNDSF